MIPIRNIYYMLAYAFQVLHEQGYKDVAAEDFRNTGFSPCRTDSVLAMLAGSTPSA